MSASLETEPPRKIVRQIERSLAGSPVRALTLLPRVRCGETRCRLARLIAFAWSRRDINEVWRAVSVSELPASDKQMLFNELWN